MKVYTVIEDIPYEGSVFYGVFATRELAERWIKENEEEEYLTLAHMVIEEEEVQGL